MLRRLVGDASLDGASASELRESESPLGACATACSMFVCSAAESVDTGAQAATVAIVSSSAFDWHRVATKVDAASVAAVALVSSAPTALSNCTGRDCAPRAGTEARVGVDAAGARIAAALFNAVGDGDDETERNGTIECGSELGSRGELNRADEESENAAGATCVAEALWGLLDADTADKGFARATRAESMAAPMWFV